MNETTKIVGEKMLYTTMVAVVGTAISALAGALVVGVTMLTAWMVGKEIGTGELWAMGILIAMVIYIYSLPKEWKIWSMPWRDVP